VSAPGGSGAPVAVVTGASGGVGRGIAVALGRAGWTVWVAARREAEGRAVANEVSEAGGTGCFVACDVAEPRSARAAVLAAAGEGRLDAVVHNATSGRSPIPVDPTSLALSELADHVAVGLRGAWALARAAHPHLAAARGSMVLLTSEAGFEGKQRLSPYAAVKAAQRGLVRSWAREWGPDGVRVNAVAPLAASPAVETAMAADETMAARVLGNLPLGRLGDPVEDIGAVVRFLVSSEARYVTGVTVMVDGGSRPVT
jgi:NAD(P)-dependent dehydrogenase (short-subunit alcohol dehydrogenase family)